MWKEKLAPATANSATFRKRMNHNREREEGECDVFQWKIFNCFSSYNRNTMSATHHHIFHRIWWSEDLLCHVHSMVYSFNDSVMVNYTTPANKQTWKTFSYFFPQRMKNMRQKYTSSFASPMTYSILYICHSFYKRISVLLLPHTTGTGWNRTRNCDGRPHPCSKWYVCRRCRL